MIHGGMGWNAEPVNTAYLAAKTMQYFLSKMCIRTKLPACLGERMRIIYYRKNAPNYTYVAKFLNDVMTHSAGKPGHVRTFPSVCVCVCIGEDI